MPQFSSVERNHAAAPSTRPLAIAFEPPIVRRGLISSVVVGTLLITINHGSAIVAGQLSTDRWVRMGLTVLVPYLVSVVSSVSTIRPIRLREANGDARPR
jgi:predicted cation transporter